MNLAVPVRKMERAIAADNLDGQFAALKDTPQLSGREEIWGQAAERMGADEPVLVLEFGVYKGKSMRFWADKFTNPASSLHGFDSFRGLPEDWLTKFPQGAFDVQGQTPNIDDDRVAFHVGWIQNTLPVFLDENAELIKNAKNVLVHIDVDIYSASLFVLATLWHKLDKFSLMFDEFSVDENQSFADFTSAFPVKYEFHSHVLNRGGIPAQVSCFVERVPLDLDT